MVHITRWRIGALLAAATVSVGVLPAAAATADAHGHDAPGESEASRSADDGSLDGDHFTFDFQTGEPIENAPVGLSDPLGFNTTAAVNMFRFTVKLASSPRVEQYRPALLAVADELRRAGVADLTIAAGQTSTVDDTSAPSDHEIVFYASSGMPCGGASVAGCAVTYTERRADETPLVKAGKVWAPPALDPKSAAFKHHVVAHELGHALGLLHYDELFEGNRQVMHSVVATPLTFRSGDLNGFRHLARDITPVGRIDSVSVPTAGELRVTGWAYDPDRQQATTVRVTIDGATVVQRATDVSRPDVDATYGLKGGAARGFDFTVGVSAGSHVVCVTAENYPRANYTQVGDCRAVTSKGAVSTSRIQGGDRYESAAAVSRSGFPATSPVVVVASGESFPDALAAGPAAARLGGPLLLTRGGALPPATASEIARLKPSTIIVAGGPATIADSVVTSLKGLTGSVVRVSGADRYETSRKLASYAFPSASTALIASGDAFPDALSAGAAAAEAGAPLILVGSGSRAADEPAASQAKALKANVIRVIGGAAVVPEDTVTTLKASVADTRRVAGSDRFQTAIEVSRTLFSAATEQVFVVNGLDFPDGLVVAPSAGRSHSPVFLSPGGCVNREVVSEMDRLGAARLTLIGGAAALNAGVAAVNVCA